ncbi:hypothetical protein C8A00DRAFT_18358 [Chaetomidium leptoderma]|uniref:Uncharacterized protein n=1 Tax=Chaetomidium leptoderma TaxID=669021 RepID=A0AAN6VH55_9PEZI|nr:hypothetical protein C8A00DRAFT_18358 [Chaetomidium leptoderma]
MNSRITPFLRRPGFLPNAPGLSECAPESTIEVQPRYWLHICPRSYGPHGARNPRLPLVSRIEYAHCPLGCGSTPQGETELLNHMQQPIGLLGGMNQMGGRIERWWMRCSTCWSTWRNFLEDHPNVQSGNTVGERGGLVATSCASCSTPFTRVCVALNCYGEEVYEVVRRDDDCREMLQWQRPSLRRVPGRVELNRQFWRS